MVPGDGFGVCSVVVAATCCEVGCVLAMDGLLRCKEAYHTHAPPDASNTAATRPIAIPIFCVD